MLILSNLVGSNHVSDIAIISGTIFMSLINPSTLGKFFIKLLMFTCKTVISFLVLFSLFKLLAFLYSDEISGSEFFK